MVTNLTKQTNSPRGFTIFVLVRYLSYNAALRLDALGYENLYWYRGGIAAWKAANLPARMTAAYRQ